MGKFLVIDDSNTSREYIKYCFYEFSEYIEILFAENTLKANVILEKEDISLIFLDWNLPGESGIEFLDVLKHNEKTKNIPIIMITGEKYKKESVLLAVKKGINDFIVKPFSKNNILSRLLPYILKSIDVKLNIFSQDKELINVLDKISKKINYPITILNDIKNIKGKNIIFTDIDIYLENIELLKNLPSLIYIKDKNTNIEKLIGNIRIIYDLSEKVLLNILVNLLLKTIFKKEILVISESTTIRKIIKAVGEKLNYNVIEAKDFLEGYRYLFNNCKNVYSIFVDYNDFDDLTNFLYKLENNIFFKDMKINILGSDKSPETLRKLSKYNIDNYILKPFTLDILIKKILD
ncbi:response regulator [Marinitoga aeolica]|uniref:Response regulator n=1 Tax=Marinitoga aeolica TaxID=2809031 RepID=A0ABY8PPC6_9BACT|nr:response regulator [Marinitoga aeolica]WGS64488.1 response regulator [Marinitoga aeolica]